MKPFVDTLQSLVDPTRLRIIRLLAVTGKELCVCELVDALDVPQYNVSRHLSLLRKAGVLSERKEGRWVYYGLSPKPSPFIRHLLAAVRSIKEDAFEKDEHELTKRMKIREGGKCLKGIQKRHLMPRLEGRG